VEGEAGCLAKTVDGIPKARDDGIEGGEVDGERWRKERGAGQRGSSQVMWVQSSWRARVGFFSLEFESPKG
jgi:hypothetical protein